MTREEKYIDCDLCISSSGTATEYAELAWRIYDLNNRYEGDLTSIAKDMENMVKYRAGVPDEYQDEGILTEVIRKGFRPERV